MEVNPVERYESISILLTPETFPIAFGNKVDELMEQGAFETREDAERWLRSTPIELEIYYEKHSGLFGVESEALDACPGAVCSPYSGEYFTESED